MPKDRSKVIAKAEWEGHKAMIKDLYIKDGRPLLGKGGVAEIMESRHHFRASKAQYEKQFKEWGWQKYKKTNADLDLLRAIILAQRTGNKGNDLFEYGRLISREEANASKAKFRLSTIEYAKLVPPQTAHLPPGYTLIPPLTIDSTPIWTCPMQEFNRLPFIRFEENVKKLWLQKNTMQYKYPRIVTCDEPDFFDLEISQQVGSVSLPYRALFGDSRSHANPDSVTLFNDTFLSSSERLNLILSSDRMHTEKSLMDPYTKVFASPLHRYIFFSLANNFAGMGDNRSPRNLPSKQICDYFRTETDEQFYGLIRSARGYSFKAIAQSLFTCAVYAGDVRITHLLLSDVATGIDPNKHSFLGLTDRPIAVACSLRHKGVIEVLLRHQADVQNITPNKIHGLQRALEWALHVFEPKESSRAEDEAIIHALLIAGARASTRFIKDRLRQKYAEILKAVILAQMPQDHMEWSQHGIFHIVLDALSAKVSLEILEKMIEVGASLDLIFEYEGNYPPGPGLGLVDIAARKGHLRCVRKLVERGVMITRDTLSCAIESGNHDVICFVQSLIPDISTEESLYIMLLKSIRTQNQPLFDSLVKKGGLNALEDHERRDCILKTALEVKNVMLLEHADRLDGESAAEVRGCALLLALEDGREDEAVKLINAGANVDFKIDEKTTPLTEALKKRNERLAHLLIDAGADVSPNRLPVLELGCSWGNDSIIRAIIQAFVNKSVKTFDLTVEARREIWRYALQRRDKEIIHILLQHAAGPQSNRYNSEDPWSPLTLAMEAKDADTMSFLLDCGEDPYDEIALEKAVEKYPDMVKILLERYRSRYPVVSKWYGALPFRKAVKQGNISLVELFLSHEIIGNGGLRPFAASFLKQMTPFGLAIVHDPDHHGGMVELFLKAHYHPDSIAAWEDRIESRQRQMSKIFYSAFMVAIETRNMRLIRLLARHGATVNLPATGYIRRTPIQVAAETGDLEVVKLLRNMGADIHAPPAKDGGGTALQLAAIGCHMDIACYLLNLGVNVDAPGSLVDGRTALEGAAEHGRTDMVQLLLNAGAGAHGKDEKQFRKAIKLAKKSNQHPVAELLEDYLRHCRGGESLPNTPGNFDDIINWDV